MSAAPKAVREFQNVGVEDVDPGSATSVEDASALFGAFVTVSPKTTNPAIASNFKTMKQFWVVLPARTPKQLTIVSRARAIPARHAVVFSLLCVPPRTQTYFAKVTATAAIPPLWVTRSNAQP